VILFEPLPVLMALLAAAALFALTVAVAHETFVAGTRESVSVKRTRPVDRGGPIRFRTGLLAVTLAKEWRLIYRDPYLISQVLLQVVFMLPLAAVVILGPNQGEGPQMPSFSPAALVAAACAVLGGTLAANLTRITISGEDAPDLLVASPVGAAAFQRAKLLAALLPVWALLAVPVGYVAFSLAPGWWAAILAPAGATVGNALICLSFPVKRPRNELIRRRNQNPLLNLLEGFTYLAWAAAGLGLASGATWGLAGVAVGMVGPGLALWRLSVFKAS
jgi:ABC-2 type transport system permease protein